MGAHGSKSGTNNASDGNIRAEQNTQIPDTIKAKVDKVKEMAKKSSYGELQGDIKVTKDENGNYNLSFTQVRTYGRIESATIGVGDIQARKETTHTVYVLNSDGKRIDTKRKTDTEYYKSENKRQIASDDWAGANANAGTSRTAKRRMSDAMRWAETQTRRK